MSAALKLQANDDLIQNAQYAVNETFRQIYGVTPTFGASLITHELHVTGDLSGIITLSQGEELTGSMILCFPKETIFAVAEKIYRKPFTAIDKSVTSCVAELCNMTYGVLKKLLNEKGFQFKMSIPNVIYGDAHSLTSHKTDTVIEIPSKIGQLSFRVILALSKEV